MASLVRGQLNLERPEIGNEGDLCIYCSAIRLEILTRELIPTKKSAIGFEGAEQTAIGRLDLTISTPSL